MARSGRRVGRSTWALFCSILLALIGSAVLPPPQPVQAETLLGSAINVATTPNQTAANPTTNRIYVTNGGAGTVTVIDGVTNTVIGTPILMGTSGSGAIGVAVDHTTNRIYVTCFNDDKVRVIDGAGNGNGGAGTLVAGDITDGDGPS